MRALHAAQWTTCPLIIAKKARWAALNKNAAPCAAPLHGVRSLTPLPKQPCKAAQQLTGAQHSLVKSKTLACQSRWTGIVQEDTEAVEPALLLSARSAPRHHLLACRRAAAAARKLPQSATW